MTTLQGRSAVITDAGRGIGRALAIELARHGVHLALVARSEDELVGTARQVRNVRDELGTIDIVVNNQAALEAHSLNLAGALLTSQQSAASLVVRLPSSATGQIWDVNDPL